MNVQVKLFLIKMFSYKQGLYCFQSHENFAVGDKRPFPL